jgi:hypothetical protein
MLQSEMRQNVDYFYCGECNVHVPCIRLEPGVWEVQCPQCVGECAVCGCHLADHCFGQGNLPARMKLRVLKSEIRNQGS